MMVFSMEMNSILTDVPQVNYSQASHPMAEFVLIGLSKEIVFPN